MIKVDIHRPIGEEDIEVPCESALVITLTKDGRGKPDACRTVIAGELTFSDLMVMTKMLAEQIEECTRQQFDLPNFNVVAMLQQTLSHRYILENLAETENTVAH